MTMAVPVHVQSGRMRFLAYLDRNRVWRDFYNHKIVEGKVTRVPYGF
jgi:hypothetical protein